MNSANLHKEFAENPDSWHNYHLLVDSNEETFDQSDIPRNVICQELNKIKTKRTREVVDLGCGKAQISDYFMQRNDTRFHFQNYDHISIDESRIITQDISDLSGLIEDDSIEIAILSLAMWGSNCKDYLLEAHRILESSGELYIIEPTKRWTNAEVETIVPADRLRKILIDSGFTIMREKIDKFALFVCAKL
jgi:ubiquinone/menaquinone biosynthesis C-methylase UbiE